MARKRLPVGRFQVMATLQAARSYVLGFHEDSAKSFGLNRAIFYAAAKRGFKKGEVAKPPQQIRIKVPLPPEKVKEIEKSFQVFYLGDEMAYSVEVEGKRYFVIGGEIQGPQDFARQIEARFGGNFEEAWKEAVELCKKMDRGVLLSQKYFYEVVYKPRRDELAKRWSQFVER